MNNLKIKLNKNSIYVISTPIGNLADLTLRALETLKQVDIIYCEDTRVTSKLLQHYNIENKTLKVYNDYSKQAVRKKILCDIEQDNIVGLVSDAGTPMIADPGYKLLRDLAANNINIEVVPGVSSPINALVKAAMPSNNFYFYGFIDDKKSAQQKLIQQLIELPTTFITFIAANKLLAFLHLINEEIADTEIIVAKELTKLYEEVVGYNAQDIINYFTQNIQKLKGEMVLLLNSRNLVFDNSKNIEQDLKSLAKIDYSVKDVAKYLQNKYKLSRNEAYQQALNYFKQ